MSNSAPFPATSSVAPGPAPTSSRDHPLRQAMVDELHARPSPRLSAPATAVYLAFKPPEDAANRDRDRDLGHLSRLMIRHGAEAPAPGASHLAATLNGQTLRYESHTEFASYAAFVPGRRDDPFDPAAAALFSGLWQDEAPGNRLVAALIHVDLLPEDPADIAPLLDRWFVADGLAVSWVVDGAAVVAADFRIDGQGWMRFAIFVRPDVGPGRIGRIVQRVAELETYRAMAMLGLPRARALTAALNVLDGELATLVDRMGDETRRADAALHDLLGLSSRLEAEATQHGFRFGATAAYAAIVRDRIAVLRESRFMGRQTLTEFMVRRFEPAMRTVESAERRLAALSDRAARAGELLRTRVDVQRSAQNQAILERMDRRADLQLRLQHTVEGLSVVAISYYAVGLIGYAVLPVAYGLGIDKAILVAALTPVVVLTAWLGMRRVRAALHDGAHPAERRHDG